MRDDIELKEEYYNVVPPKDWGWMSLSARHRIIDLLLSQRRTPPPWLEEEARKIGIYWPDEN